MIYRCRTTVPAVSDWFEIQATTPEEASAELHYQYDEKLQQICVIVEEPGNRYIVYFVRVEVEGHDSWISRLFQHGIWRKGGVKPLGWRSHSEALKDAAEKLGWSFDPMKLIEPGWECEDSMEEAPGRRRGKYKAKETSFMRRRFQRKAHVKLTRNALF